MNELDQTALETDIPNDELSVLRRAFSCVSLSILRHTGVDITPEAVDPKGGLARFKPVEDLGDANRLLIRMLQSIFNAVGVKPAADDTAAYAVAAGKVLEAIADLKLSLDMEKKAFKHLLQVLREEK